MKRFVGPFALLITVCVVLAYALFHHSNHELPAAVVGIEIPIFSLPTIDHKSTFSNQDLKGHVSLLHVWASWCSVCRDEHAMLMEMVKQTNVAIYGVTYKDDISTVNAWLSANGNPYRKVADDQQGDLVIDLGIYGTPETFVIGPDSKVLYRQVGEITMSDWEESILPVINANAHAERQ